MPHKVNDNRKNNVPASQSGTNTSNHTNNGTWQDKNPTNSNGSINANGNTVICDDTEEETSYKGSLPPKPRVVFIERIVELLLKDPEFNIKRLPDSIEKTVYNFVVYIIFDNIVNGVWGLNHVSFLGHITEMEMVYCHLPDQLPMGLEKLDKVAISKLVDAIMKKKLLNLTWLPDAIEKNLYYCILLITFTILEILASSMVINIVGHAFRLKFGPNGKGYANVEDKLQSILSSEESQKNIDLLVQSMLANPELNNSYIPDFMERSIYKTVYSLILCLIEEIFYDLHIDILGNIIHIHLVPDTWREVIGSGSSFDNENNSDVSLSITHKKTYKDAVFNNNESSTIDDDGTIRNKTISSSSSSTSYMVQEIDINNVKNNTSDNNHDNILPSQVSINNAVSTCSKVATAAVISHDNKVTNMADSIFNMISCLWTDNQYTLLHLLLAFLCGMICTTFYNLRNSPPASSYLY